MEEQRDIVDRIRDIMAYYRYNQQDMEDKTGVKQQNLSAILNRRRPCGEGVAARIAISLDVNHSWLLTGEGEMLRTPPANTAMTVGHHNTGQVAQGGSTISVGGEAAYLDIIREQQRQMAKMQDQYDRLLTIIEKMQNSSI